MAMYIYIDLNLCPEHKFNFIAQNKIDGGYIMYYNGLLG